MRLSGAKICKFSAHSSLQVAAVSKVLTCPWRQSCSPRGNYGSELNYVVETLADFSLEAALHKQGFAHIAGVDEAGRGPLAGPVVAAAVILDPACIPSGLDDSKKLTEKRREILFGEIAITSSYCVVSAPPSLIEKYNIRGATLWAMHQAVAGLHVLADVALIDGRDVPPNLSCEGKAIIKGDGKSISIAAASIVAKVTRDRMCQQMQIDFPLYGFGKHKGYGSAAHLQNLNRHGPCPHHRATFGPVAKLLGSD